MLKPDAEEAARVTRPVLAAILNVTATRGRPGADLRTAIGAFQADALRLFQYQLSGPPLAEIFDMVRKGGASLAQLAHIRAVAANQSAQSLGAVLVKNSLINFGLVTEARIIADTSFRSRNAADEIKDRMNIAFAAMEEIAADDMDSATYRVLIALHAAVTLHLVKSERPLPRMLNFRFAAPGSTLIFAYKLYDDAGRADELREENKIIHPAFARPIGKALSS